MPTSLPHTEFYQMSSLPLWRLRRSAFFYEKCLLQLTDDEDGFSRPFFWHKTKLHVITVCALIMFQNTLSWIFITCYNTFISFYIWTTLQGVTFPFIGCNQCTHFQSEEIWPPLIIPCPRSVSYRRPWLPETSMISITTSDNPGAFFFAHSLTDVTYSSLFRKQREP